jgi:3-isopropylmalate/(R)-2-methylmalate dehydratase small subunit
VLDTKVVDQLIKEAQANPGYRLAVDLEQQTVTTPGRQEIQFDIDPFRKHCLLNGLDEIGLTLERADKIRAFETRHRAAQPWLFG